MFATAPAQPVAASFGFSNSDVRIRNDLPIEIQGYENYQYQLGKAAIIQVVMYMAIFNPSPKFEL